MPTDLSYFLVRASEERTAALRQPDPRVRQAHLELAERYEERVREIVTREEPLFFPSRRKG
jgi:hypothetical protein